MRASKCVIGSENPCARTSGRCGNRGSSCSKPESKPAELAAELIPQSMVTPSPRWCVPLALLRAFPLWVKRKQMKTVIDLPQTPQL